MKKTLALIRCADTDFNMIRPGDRVMVGVSGGKDSLLLLTALAAYRQFATNPFEVCGGMIDLGFGDLDAEALLAYCQTIGVELHIKPTNIGHVIFETRRESNPCSLCAKMRRGSLGELAKLHGCNKIALGHHRDDLVETLLMSMLCESRLRTFAPVTWLDRSDIVQIRPLIYMEERHIISLTQRLALPVARNACPACGHTMRQQMKELVKSLRAVSPDADRCIFNAIKNTDQYELWNDIPTRPEVREEDKP